MLCYVGVATLPSVGWLAVCDKKEEASLVIIVVIVFCVGVATLPTVGRLCLII